MVKCGGGQGRGESKGYVVEAESACERQCIVLVGAMQRDRG